MHAHPCGQCMPCRLNRRRLWTHRLLLESLMHGDSCFVTLTYNTAHRPIGGDLVPKDLQDWLKRLRKAVAPVRLRYYCVGEYGTSSERAHYHGAIFGLPGCAYGKTRVFASGRSCCSRCDLVQDTWGKGHVFLGELSSESAQYIAGYVTKKMTSKNDPRLNGRHPEFARMSLKPGIGYSAIANIADTLRSFNLDNPQDDVPSVLRHGKKLLPLGRYLRRKLRYELYGSEDTPENVQKKIAEDMLDLYEVSRNSAEGVSVKKLLLEKNQGALINLQNRDRIWKKKDTL